MSAELERYKALVPAYISGKLNEKELEEFQEAIERFPELAQTVEEDMALRRTMKKMEQECNVRSDAIFSKVEARVSEEENPISGHIQKAPGFLAWLRDMFASPRLAWGMCALQAAALAVVFWVQEPDFRTMSTSNPTNKHAIALNVVFKKEANIDQVLELLKKNQGRIVDGPAGPGVFLIEIPKEVGIGGIKTAKIVEFAEPAY